MKNGVLLLVSALVLMGVSCTKPDDKKASDLWECQDGELKNVGIFGGKTVSSESALARGMVFVINTDTEKENQMEICTGSVIDNNIVLTAAHCVPSSEDSSKVFVTFSVDPICKVHNEGRKGVYEVDRVVRNNRYYDRGDDNSDDLALIRLQNKVPSHYKPLKLMDREIELNENSEVYISGFGKTKGDYNEKTEERHTLKIAQVKPLLESNDPKKITKSNRSTLLYFDQRNGQGGCAGDSGGPTLIKDKGSMFVVGVNSAVDTLTKDDFKKQSEVTCKIGLSVVSVFAQRDWISKNYKDLLNSDSLGNQFGE